MSQNGFFFRTVGLLFLIGLVVLGGFIAFRAGLAQGLAQAPEIADVIQKEQAIVRPSYGFTFGYGFPSFGGICISILFVFLLLGLLRFMFCGVKRWYRDEPASAATDAKPTL